ncbi:rhodanese-like domain-containing protein [Betaproteobacteria bacterium SCN2]|jgi:rhodanese-related sulfurtransferase|nr:rhodanese-like domain-containing protein [Betaproteobacteria bacterium SCN2]
MEFVQDNLLLVIAAGASGAMLLWSFFGNRVSGISEVNTMEATRLMNEEALLLDVRDDNEWAAGRLPNARHIRLAELSKRLSELEKYKDKPIVVYCRSGHRSARACALLKKSGFANPNNLVGGIMAWQQANLPVTRK